MLRETLKKDIDQLSESQLQAISDCVNTVKAQAQPVAEPLPFWQHATPTERSQDFRQWVTHLPNTAVTLADDAFDRGSIYE